MSLAVAASAVCLAARTWISDIVEALVDLLRSDSGRLRIRTPQERFWVRYQPFLLARGYELRPRFSPDWIPSWKGPNSDFLFLWQCEDAQSVHPRGNGLDAIRIGDGLKVMLKRVPTHTAELPLTSYLSSLHDGLDARNRSVNLLDVIPIPGDDSMAFLVLPFLRPVDDPPFHCRVEIVESFRQFLEGLVFMHEHNVAHRDACLLNLMMDCTKVIPKGYHYSALMRDDSYYEWLEYHRRCAVAPVDYYFIDFGLSKWYPEGPDDALDVGIFGQIQTVPELSWTAPYNPFKVDIYHLGYAFKRIMGAYAGLPDVFAPLLRRMTNSDPRRRPSASIALEEFDCLVSRLTEDELASELIPLEKPSTLERCIEDGGEPLPPVHIFRKARPKPKQKRKERLFGLRKGT